MNSCVNALVKLNLIYNYYIEEVRMDLKPQTSTVDVITKDPQSQSLKVRITKFLVDMRVSHGHLLMVDNIKMTIKHLFFQLLIKPNMFNTNIITKLLLIIRTLDQYLEVDVIFIFLITQIRITPTMLN